nr:uncharacterized protein LOC127328415 [Lolium perenne]
MAVVSAMSPDFCNTLGPRLSLAAEAELRDLANVLSSVDLRHDTPDTCACRLTNSKLSNKSFYFNSFRHLQIDDVACKVWKSAAPLRCKIFCWLARKKRLPTNERRFRHHLCASVGCPSCSQDEDVAHLLFRCPQALQVWKFFYPDFDEQGPSSLTEFWSSCCPSYVTTTITTAIAWSIWKRRNGRVFHGIVEDLALVTQRCIEDIRLWAVNKVVQALL